MVTSSTIPVHTSASGALLERSDVNWPVYASPALAGGTIFIRGEQHLYAIRTAAREKE
ncbi:hypothetical protein BH23ACI1_BH23ACI1_24720 [soil metagenome]|nr:hypothetical protein [Acidobacteriota bacterium]